MKNCWQNQYFVAFFSTLIIGAGLLITSFFLPPTGKIDPSVLQGTALLLAWPAIAFAAKALDDNKKIKISTKIGTVTVGKIEGDEIQLEDAIDQMEGETEDE